MSAIEFVFLTPLLFFMIFAAVQFAMYSFADQVAQAAAQAGAREGRATANASPGGWQGKARDTVDSYIQQLGPQLVLRPVVVTDQPTPNTVRVEITAKAPSIVPGLELTIHAQSSGPVERFVQDGG
ncbi:TadE family protein [Streptomyces sp. NPDC060048]|uniref:TadE family protein n=1 Tax=unclassified Streptomyces TaxID=2593676 RepID=UPI003682977D